MTPTPETIARALIDAENAHDVEAVLALFAPDAIADLAMGERHTTPDAIRAWQSELAAGHFQMEVDDITTEGNSARWTGRLALDRLRHRGVDGVVARWQITVREGKIVLFDVKMVG